MKPSRQSLHATLLGNLTGCPIKADSYNRRSLSLPRYGLARSLLPAGGAVDNESEHVLVSVVVPVDVLV